MVNVDVLCSVIFTLLAVNMVAISATIPSSLDILPQKISSSEFKDSYDDFRVNTLMTELNRWKTTEDDISIDYHSATPSVNFTAAIESDALVTIDSLDEPFSNTAHVDGYWRAESYEDPTDYWAVNDIGWDTLAISTNEATRTLYNFTALDVTEGHFNVSTTINANYKSFSGSQYDDKMFCKQYLYENNNSARFYGYHIKSGYSGASNYMYLYEYVNGTLTKTVATALPAVVTSSSYFRYYFQILRTQTVLTMKYAVLTSAVDYPAVSSYNLVSYSSTNYVLNGSSFDSFTRYHQAKQEINVATVTARAFLDDYEYHTYYKASEQERSAILYRNVDLGTEYTLMFENNIVESNSYVYLDIGLLDSTFALSLGFRYTAGSYYYFYKDTATLINSNSYAQATVTLLDSLIEFEVTNTTGSETITVPFYDYDFRYIGVSLYQNTSLDAIDFKLLKVIAPFASNDQYSVATVGTPDSFTNDFCLVSGIDTVTTDTFYFFQDVKSMSGYMKLEYGDISEAYVPISIFPVYFDSSGSYEYYNVNDGITVELVNDVADSLEIDVNSGADSYTYSAALTITSYEFAWYAWRSGDKLQLAIRYMTIVNGEWTDVVYKSYQDIESDDNNNWFGLHVSFGYLSTSANQNAKMSYLGMTISKDSSKEPLLAAPSTPTVYSPPATLDYGMWNFIVLPLLWVFGMIAGALGSGFTGLVGGLLKGIADLFDWIGEAIDNLVAGILSLATTIWNGLIAGLSAIGDGIGDLIWVLLATFGLDTLISGICDWITISLGGFATVLDWSSVLLGTLFTLTLGVMFLFTMSYISQKSSNAIDWWGNFYHHAFINIVDGVQVMGFKVIIPLGIITIVVPLVIILGL